MRVISGSCSPEAKKYGLFDDRREEFPYFAGGELRAALSPPADKESAAPHATGTPPSDLILSHHSQMVRSYLGNLMERG